jgi:hypothetical protein
VECPKAAIILAKLLSPDFESKLQEYVNRYRVDPHFLAHHGSTTILTLRQELDLPFTDAEPCADCINNSLANCGIIDVLEATIRQTTAARDGLTSTEGDAIA